MQIPFTTVGDDGSPLHFAHANGYPPGAYRQFLAALGRRYRVLAMEQRPLWPGEDPNQLQSWRLFADDLLRFLQQQALRDVIGVGHSLGAVATMMAALKEPDRFRALVLIEPVFLPPDLLQAAAAAPQEAANMDMVTRTLKRRHRWPSAQAAFDRYRSKRVFQRLSDEALWDYVNAGLRETGEGQLTLRFPREWEAAIYARPPLDVWELIPQVSHRTLAVRGEHSQTLQPADWERWQQLQPDARFVQMDGAGHLLPLEQPQRLADTVLRFLAEETR